MKVPDDGYYVPDDGYYVPDDGYYVPDDGYWSYLMMVITYLMMVITYLMMVISETRRVHYDIYGGFLYYWCRKWRHILKKTSNSIGRTKIMANLEGRVCLF
jgi:hypothetical protein